MKYINVCRADLSRWFLRKRFFLAVAGVFILNYLLMLQDLSGLEDTSVVYTVFIYLEDPFFIINYIFAAAVFGTAYCEERKRNYFSFFIKRCDRKSYIISKVMNCFFSSFCVVTVGMFLWELSLRLFMPWADRESDMFWVCVNEGLGNLLEEHRYFTYYLIYSMGLGMLSGIISVITFMISLFIKDQMAVISLPGIIYYIYNAYVGDFSDNVYFWSLEHIFYFPKSRMTTNVLTFTRATIYALILCLIFGMISYKRLERVCHE
ncbi:MAG: hypothetical protein Q4B70_06080 [Lachnospiraceae bacterium]|nr:hypothetical protein [Lachnospiraceae bacterium]